MFSQVADTWALPDASADDRGSLCPVLELPWPGLEDGRRRPVNLRPVGVQEYLEFEGSADTKHEYVNGFIYAMAGASDAHVTITLNIAAGLKAFLRGTRCRTYASDMRVEIAGATASSKGAAYYYPDVIVTCSESDRQSAMTKREPTAVVEVLSKSTRNKDSNEKLENYRVIPTLRQVLLVDQDRRRIVVHTRGTDGWMIDEVSAGAVTFALPSGELEMSVSDIYEDVLGLDEP